MNYLEIREGTSLQWQCPVFDGPTPSPRESHAAITVGTRLLIYGGMNGRRLGDVWMLEVGKYNYTSFSVHMFILQIACSGTVSLPKAPPLYHAVCIPRRSLKTSYSRLEGGSLF